MATYAIGDVQGCYDELLALLDLIAFEPQKDCLWFAGDLVNRGPQSLEVLRFIKQLPHTHIVLGNHDLHLLALANGHAHHKHTLHDVLNAPDLSELINWLRQQPLLHYDTHLNYLMVHAGLPPQWDLTIAQQCAQEVEAILRSEHYAELLKNMYGDEPNKWQPNLIGLERQRFIINALTRIRFCDKEGRLNLHTKTGLEAQPTGYLPWFKIPGRLNGSLQIVFGHWAALQGVTEEARVHALDTGCVWGNALTAMRLEDGQRFSVACLRSNVKKL